MCTADLNPDTARLAAQLNAKWEKRWGSILGSEGQRHALGFGSAKALGKAIARGQLGLPFFTMPNRRGHFLLTEEAACFVARQRAAAGEICPASDEKKGDTDMS